MPLVEQWEEYVVPKHSPWPATDEKDFLFGTRVMASLDKVGSQYLRTDFCRDARCFLEKFVNCALSTVPSRSVLGQGLSCFWPAIVVDGDDVAPFQLFNKLLDGLLEKGGTRGREIAAWRAEYQSSVQEQWQLEPSFTRSRPIIDDILSFCFAQAGLRARRQLYKLCIVSNQACCFDPHELFHPSMRFCCFRSSSWRILWSAGLQLMTKNSILASIVLPSMKRKCVVPCSVCRIFFGAFTSHREVSSQNPAWQCCLSPLLSLIALYQVQSMTRGVLWSQHVRASSSLISVLVGIGLCCVVALRKTLVRVGTMVAHLGVRQHQGQGWEFQTSLRRGVLNTSPVLGPPGPSKIRSSSSKRKRKISRSPVKLPRRFQVWTPPASPQRRSLA